MTRPSGYRSQFGKFADQMRDPDPAKGRQAAREMREMSGGKFVFFNTDNMPWPQATRVNQLADEIYGPMKGKGQ